ncbi:sterol desaturase family protein [Stigmatella sp. ncwal1]|uniref:Sterol desaturase family protein n=1 Tax=Stigmatella ashevillensis TaxID=2995309 RepID=A0ABT5D8G5_9BACT|nr:sterol desaturase family protein [Stigmatella ashevillena]MDC0709113.1 sterol desaturase family protein [Stigmatella ashevillena]
MNFEQPLQDFAQRAPLPVLGAITALGFALIYFGLGGLGTWLSRRYFPQRGLGHVIDERPVRPRQVREEVGLSLVSIAIFGGYGALTMALDARGLTHIRWELTATGLAVDLLVLALWNEVHFYACHRLLHTRWLFRHVHSVHHRSRVPTPFSTYSFHPVEALLLGSVMVTLQLFYDLSFWAALTYPVVSLLMNTLGHLNYALATPSWWSTPLRASEHHSLHHRRVNGNFGFQSPVLDRLLGTELPSQEPIATREG